MQRAVRAPDGELPYLGGHFPCTEFVVWLPHNRFGKQVISIGRQANPFAKGRVWCILQLVTHEEMLARLGLALRRLVRSEGLLLKDLSIELGFSSDYIGRCFRGRYPLRLALVFPVLQRLTVAPWEFFEAVFPFGGQASLEMQAKGRLPQLDLLDEQSWADWYRTRLLDQNPRNPKEWAKRFGLALRRAIEDRRRTQREISEWMGLGPHALGLALRGNTELAFFHVFGVLEFLKLPPGRFFTEVFAQEPADAGQRLRLKSTLDWYGGVMEITSETFLSRRKAKAEKARLEREKAEQERAEQADAATQEPSPGDAEVRSPAPTPEPKPPAAKNPETKKR